VLVVGAWRATRPSTGYDLDGFAKLPVVSNGRIQPLDSLARNRLLAIHGKQKLEDASSVAWLAELCFKPQAADQRPVFLIYHDDLLGLLELSQEDGKYFSFIQIAPHLSKMADEAARIAVLKSQTWSTYEKALMGLWRNLGHYQQLRFSIAHPESAKLESDLTLLLEKAREALTETDAALIEAAAARMQVLKEWATQTDVFTQPPPAGGKTTEWLKLPDSATASVATGSLHPSSLAYARLGDAWREGDVANFNSAVSTYQTWLKNNSPSDLRKTAAETIFNNLAPFYVCMALYVVAFLCAILFWR
jgi:hypothetical protein